MEQPIVKENLGRVSKISKAFRRALGSISRPFLHVFTVNFWLGFLLLINILFFLASIFDPIRDRYVEMTDFSGAAQELMLNIELLEEESGVELPEFIDSAVDAYSDLHQSVLQSNAMSERVLAALVEPTLIFRAKIIPESEIDCLGTIEQEFRNRGATSIVSFRSARQAEFEGSLGFTHAVAAICLNSVMTLSATGYNSAGTEEIVEDLLAGLERGWGQEEGEQDCINC